MPVAQPLSPSAPQTIRFLAPLLLICLSLSPSQAQGGGDVSNQNFYKQAKRSISHDQRVLKRLESHPLAHSSGWEIQQNQGQGGGWSERSVRTGPRLGGKQWQKKNDQLENELERMSDSVNVMFKDQNSKKRYQKDEDKLFNQAVKALKTADQLYPDSGDDADLANLEKGTDSGFAHDEGRRRRRRSQGGTVNVANHRNQMAAKSSRRLRSWFYGPDLTEVTLILIGCTLLAAAGWVGFMFFKRKTYKDLRVDRDRPEGIEVP